MDKLNSFIGLLIAEREDGGVRKLLLFIQSKLFTVSSYLTTDPTKTEYKIESRVTGDSVGKIEEAIDRIDSQLPKMKAFVLPGGSRTAALAHVCRTVCRRAERNIYRLMETESVEDLLLVFMNRLSDLLFVIARKECLVKNGEEIFWNNTCK